MREAKHTEGKLHYHGREIHLFNEKPLDHICIAEVNNALLEPMPVVEKLIHCWNSQATLIEQRDALKTALENLIKQYQIYTNFVDHEKCWEIIEARAALAKCDNETSNQGPESARQGVGPADSDKD